MLNKKSRALVALFAVLFASTSIMYAACTCNDKAHKDKKVTRCEYAQQDIKRTYATNAERYKQMGIDEHTCFYCGCPIDMHTQEKS